MIYTGNVFLGLGRQLVKNNSSGAERKLPMNFPGKRSANV